MTSPEIDGAKLVEAFKAEYPDAYGRWFLLEAIGLGIEPIGNEVNAFIWARFGQGSDLVPGTMAMREVIWAEARAFLDGLAPDLELWQRLDVKQRMTPLIEGKTDGSFGPH